MRTYSEFCKCINPDCDAEQVQFAPSVISARIAKGVDNARVMRRQCARCGTVWDEDLSDGKFYMFDASRDRGNYDVPDDVPVLRPDFLTGSE